MYDPDPDVTQQGEADKEGGVDMAPASVFDQILDTSSPSTRRSTTEYGDC